MSVRSVMRVVLAVAACASVGLPWVERVRAAEKEINATLDAAKCDKKWGPPCFTPANGTINKIRVGDTVTWRATDGTHTVTPVDPSAFSESGDLTGPDATFSVTFDKPGLFSFYCKHHGSVEDGGKTHHGMWGKIEVEGEETTTTTTEPPPPPSPPPTEPPPPARPDPGPPPSTSPPPSPPSTSPAPTSPPPTSPPPTSPPPTSRGSAGPSSGHGQTAAETGRPYVGPPPTAPPPSPPPTRAAASEPPPKPRDDKERGSSPETTSPADVTAVPPDELVMPPVPQFSSPTTAPVAEAPAEVPQGDTVAVLKNESDGRRRKLILLGTLFGVGAFALGVGGWKYATRPSKYWPA